jgi:hypothetical protein
VAARDRRGQERNWFALLALWTALLTWLIVIASAVAIATFADEGLFNVVGWVALAVGTAALVLAVAGITMIRTRGETAVAVTALALVLALTTFASPFFLYGGLIRGD